MTYSKLIKRMRAKARKAMTEYRLASSTIEILERARIQMELDQSTKDVAKAMELAHKVRGGIV